MALARMSMLTAALRQPANLGGWQQSVAAVLSSVDSILAACRQQPANGAVQDVSHFKLAVQPPAAELLPAFSCHWPLAASSCGAALHQRRGMAGPVRPRRPRPASAPDRNLPARNELIRAEEVRVVFPEAECRATTVMPLPEAISAAKQRSMDLVLMSAGAVPPVARIVEWDKVVFGLRKKEKAAEKSQREHRRLAVPKEVRVGCHTAEHDLGMKVVQAQRFLKEGHHLRLAVTFKGGREILTARQRLGQVLDQIADLIIVKDQRGLQRPQMNQWVVQLAPKAAAPPPKSAPEPRAQPSGAAPVGPA